MERLEQALAIYVDWRAAGQSVAPSALLSSHPELSDLLEAMLADRDMLDARAGRAADEGHVLGDFRIVEEIGRGGMGVVYRARQISLDREIALKVLPPHVAQSLGAIARFRREATTAARLEHPNIVRVFGTGSDGDVHWFAMELVDGAPLARTDPRTGVSLSIRACAELCATVADALEYAHRRGVVHRDVKPSNILVRRTGEPALSDFGLARDLDQPGLTQFGTFAGTPHYVSPEQAAGRTVVDGRTDVFSLGATLYELLTGTRPFDGESVAAVLAQIERTEPRDPVRIVPELSPDLAAVVLKALEKDPDRRYASAAALAADLRAFLDHRPVSARRASLVTRLGRWARREPIGAALAGVLTVGVPAISAAVGYLLANRSAIELGAEQLRGVARQERLAGITIDHEAGDLVRALAAAESAVAADPADVEARALRAVVQLAAGHPETALAELHDAPGIDPELEDRARVYVLAALGREDQARAIERRLGPPQRASELYLAGCVAAHRAQRDGAERDEWKRVCDTFAHAMRVSPSPRLHYHVRWMEAAQLAADPPTVADAVTTLRTLWPDSPAALLYVAYALRETDPAQAVSDYRRVLAAGYDHPRIHSTIARCLERLGDREGALASRQHAVESFERRAADGLGSPDEYVNVALVLDALGEPRRALDAARRATERFPALPRAWRVLGWLLETTGDAPAAVAAFRTATDLSPSDAEALARLGWITSQIGDADAAVDAYRRLTALRPRDAIAHHHLGNALLASGDTAGAVEANRTAAALDPERPELHFNLAFALHAAGSPADAERACDAAIARRPDYGRAHALLGDLRLARGDGAAAAASYRAALAIEADQAAVWVGLGEALLRMDDRSGACEALREAAARTVDAPGSAALLRRIAAALVRAGDAGAARDALSRALACASEDADRGAIQRELDALRTGAGR